MANGTVLNGDVIRSTLDDPRTYRGVLTRRIMAFLVDLCIVFLLCIPAAIVIFVLGILTLSLGWVLYGILFPLVAIPYVWWTVSSPHQATIGMRMMDIRLERIEGGRIDGALAIAHSVLFWAGNALLTPLVLLIALFTRRKQTLHDLLLRTVVVRATEPRI
ncbi:RDD family protein [Limoniibacter endophyticus]|uniref:RDD family protein n=1 Tax=Limoniibacter endophyticus TaxID=1565040 RepID=A0A8J3DP73_9HYPH|nr:RDD family protein [Limoniibacter endophyticus]GHC68422.1 RDD family protein [Limoniibacter endophyticus]